MGRSKVRGSVSRSSAETRRRSSTSWCPRRRAWKSPRTAGSSIVSNQSGETIPSSPYALHVGRDWANGRFGHLPVMRWHRSNACVDKASDPHLPLLPMCFGLQRRRTQIPVHERTQYWDGTVGQRDAGSPDEAGFSRKWCDMKRLVFADTFGLISRHALGLRFLDVGCGPGHFVEHAQASDLPDQEIQPGRSACLVANRRPGDDAMKEGLLTSDSYAPGSLAAVTPLNVLEHVVYSESLQMTHPPQSDIASDPPFGELRRTRPANRWKSGFRLIRQKAALAPDTLPSSAGSSERQPATLRSNSLRRELRCRRQSDAHASSCVAEVAAGRTARPSVVLPKGQKAAKVERSLISSTRLAASAALCS